MKQYLLLCDEEGIAKLNLLLTPNLIQFLEVLGIVDNDGKFNVLVSPLPQPPELPVDGFVVPEGTEVV